MDPKLLRMYSDILSEVIDPRYANQARADAAKKAANAPPQKTFSQVFPQAANKEVSPQSQSLRSAFASALGFGDKPTAQTFPTQNLASTPTTASSSNTGTPTTTASAKPAPQGGRGALPTSSTKKSAAPAIDPRVAAARKADAARQAAAPAPGTTQDPSGGQGNRAFLPGAAGGAKPETPSAQTTPDQMPTTTAVGAKDIGFTGPGTTATAPTMTGQSSYTSPTGVALGAEKPEEPGSGASSYTSTAGASMGAGGQSAMPSDTAVKSGTPGVNWNISTRDYSKMDKSEFEPGAQYRQALKPGPAMEESEMSEEVEESLEEELAEAFNDMLRLSGLEKKNLEESKTLVEKAVSRQQQKFMGMVHAMQKGEKIKGASPELKKVAKTMGKKDAKDFAATKHKGLPQKVSEGLNLMLDEEGHTLNHIVNKYKHEVKSFLDGADMSENLYDALYDYYLDRGEMPYGIAKAREGDPYQWVADRFYSEVGVDMNEAPMYEVAHDDTLNELARLAGLSESRVDECGDMGMDSEDKLNVSTNMSSDGTKSVNISAQGEKAEELLSMLKLAGMGESDRPSMVMIDRDEEMMDEEREIEYANTPAEEYETVASITRQGNDLNREKKQFANMPKAGDNPMATDYMLDEELSALLDSVLVKETDPRRPKGDTGIADIYTADKGIPPPSPDEGPVGKAATPKAPAAPTTPKMPPVSGIKR